jgi:hypothetical protein
MVHCGVVGYYQINRDYYFKIQTSKREEEGRREYYYFKKNKVRERVLL